MGAQPLKQQIINATSGREIDELLATGETYEFASKKTRQAWRNAAARRRAELK